MAEQKPKNAIEFKKMNRIRTRNAILKGIRENKIKSFVVTLPDLKK